jgi:hypothetical protein
LGSFFEQRPVMSRSGIVKDKSHRLLSSMKRYPAVAPTSTEIGIGEWRKLLATAKGPAHTAKGLRDLAIIRLLHDLALRRSEVINLTYRRCRLDQRDYSAGR